MNSSRGRASEVKESLSLKKTSYLRGFFVCEYFFLALKYIRVTIVSDAHTRTVYKRLVATPLGVARLCLRIRINDACSLVPE